jgi:hypothetical protein
MEAPKIWLEIAIAGFVYVAAAFFSLLSWLHINDLCFLWNAREFAPYLSIGIILFSYVIGLSVHNVLHQAYSKVRGTKTWRTISKSFDKDQAPNEPESDKGEDLFLREDISPRVLELIKSSYNTFVLFRLLALGTPLLCLSLIYWMSNTKFKDDRLPAAATLALLTILFAVTYVSLRPSQRALKRYASKQSESSIQ